MKLKHLLAVALVAVGISGLLCSCSRPDEARRVLDAQGYTDITITGWRPFMASDSDTFSTGFEATSPGGKRVTGAVTSGFLKGATVRLD